MKKNEVKIGGLYTAKVSDRIVKVRIDSTNTHGGWNATNTATGKRIRVKSAQRLRKAVAGDDTGPDVQLPESPEGKKRNGKKADGEKKPKRTSALDAAAQVLKNTGKPMRAHELIAAMTEQGLWTSPGGKTPHATLYAAIIREIAVKGKAARFRKADRGLFEYNAA